MIVASLDVRASRKQALGYVLANFVGGIFSIVLIMAMVLSPSLVTFTLVMLAASLIAGWRISRGEWRSDGGGPQRLHHRIELEYRSQFGNIEVWLTRLSHFLFAAAVSIGMMALLMAST